MNDKWIVDIKGSHDQSFELSVVRESNRHGRISYGWMGRDKIFIPGSGGPCKDTVSKAVLQKLMRVAEETAAELNFAELP